MLHGVFPIEEIRAEPHADFFCQCVGRPRCPSCASRLQDQSRSPRIRPGLVVVQVDVQRGGYRIQFMIFQLRPYPLGNLYRA